ncbi:MAG: OmpA family protein [Cyclobacteriaceae bacterium]|nr:OmpA family protein [Cyclobacteriaceae bacterium]
MNQVIYFLVCLIALPGLLQAQLATTENPDPPKKKKQFDYQLKRLDKKVNSPWHEGAPVISTDGKSLYFFVADHPDNNYGTKGSQDIWFTEKTSQGDWREAQRLTAPLNQQRYNQVMSVNNEGNTLLLRGGSGKSSKGFSLSNRTATGWSNPRPLRIQGLDKMSKGVYSGGIMTQDGKVLIMYFNELKGQKISDLYVSFLQENGDWSEPQFIKELNTRQDEFGPSLDPDGKTLYFASGRPGGSGSTDIYVTRRLDDSWLHWSEPINLGAPVNTSGFDAYYSVDDKGNVFTTRAYMSLDGGSLDILSLIPVEKPKPKLMVWGHVYDRETNDPVSAQVKYEIHQLEVDNVVSEGYDGFYEVKLTGDGKYQIITSSEGYMNGADDLEVPELEADTIIQKDLYLDRIEIGTTVRLNNIFFDFDKTDLRPESITELNAVVDFLKNNPTVKIEIGGHTDSKGSDQYNINLSDGRAGSVRGFLLEHWIDSNRVISTGYGEAQPVATNVTDEGRQQNRRVEFTILEK